MMNVFAAGDEMRGPLVCPKPRRVGLLFAPNPIRSLRWQSSYQVDPHFDMFLTKKGEQQEEPFFIGSPPTRSANPLVNDARFGEVAAPVNDLVMHPNPNAMSGPAVPIPIPVSARASSGCSRTKFGFSPATVRVEGFDCLDRDHRSRTRGIPAVA